MAEPPQWDDVATAIAAGRDSALQEVLQRVRIFSATDAPITIQPPSGEWLETLDRVSEDTLVIFLDLLYNHPFLSRMPSPTERQDEAVDANLRYGTHRTAFHHALLLSLAANSYDEAAQTLWRLQARGVLNDAELTVAKYLVSNLLDYEGTRRATVRALCWMKERNDLRPVVQYVGPQLEPGEAAEIADW